MRTKFSPCGRGRSSVLRDPILTQVRKARSMVEQEAGGSVRGLFVLMRKSRGQKKRSVLKEEPAKTRRFD